MLLVRSSLEHCALQLTRQLQILLISSFNSYNINSLHKQYCPSCLYNGECYLKVLEENMIPFFHIHECTHFMQDGAPCHTARKVMKFLNYNNITILEWPGNSSDLNPIENVWCQMKNRLVNCNTSSLPHLIKELRSCGMTV